MMMLEAKAEFARRNGQPLVNHFLIHAELISRMNSLTAPLANWGARNSLLRTAMEAVVGIDRRRTLPAFSAHPFLRSARERYVPEQSSGRKVVYFVDLFANYNDPQLAEAFILVMNHNGVEVAVPRDQKACGMPPMDYGALPMARRIARQQRAALAPVDRAGICRRCQRANRHPHAEGRVPVSGPQRRHRDALPRHARCDGLPARTQSRWRAEARLQASRPGAVRLPTSPAT